MAGVPLNDISKVQGSTNACIFLYFNEKDEIQRLADSGDESYDVAISAAY